MEELLRPATDVTMSPRRQVSDVRSSSATGTSDWSAEEASPARAARLDKQNAKGLCYMCRKREACAESVRRKLAHSSM